MSTISRSTESLLRTRLEPAPRALVDGLPVLALEHGAFELSTAVTRRGDVARVLISPRGSSSLFDELLPVLGGGTAISTLSMTPTWDAAKSIGGGDVYFLQRREVSEETGEDNGFMALSATIEPNGFGARFIASDPAMLGDAGSPHGAWPSRAIDALEQDAVLCVAGSPESAGGDVQRTLLLGLLDMLSLPDELRSSMRGVAVIAVHEPSEDPAPGAMAITLAMPFEDIRAIAPSAERWAGALTDGPVLEQGRGHIVRSASIAATDPEFAPEFASGYLGRGGAIAWTFARAPADTQSESGRAGWWVVSIRTAPGDVAPSASRVSTLAATLEQAGLEQGGERDNTMFRLVVRPSRLAAITAEVRRDDPALASDARVASAAKLKQQASALNALRWIDRVESRLNRGPRGVIDGSVSVRLRTELLNENSGPIRE
jgi:hypothetical protein